MPDAIFAHPRLARIYDAFDGDRGDLSAYLAIAEEVRARRVIDVGCGTGTLATLLARKADLATMTGNVAQVLLTDDDWARALQAIHAALRPNGYLVFETRRPECRAWEEWAADVDPVTLDIPGSGHVERRLAVTDVSLPFVSFQYTYRFLSGGDVVTSNSTLRFRSRDEVESSLNANGYRVLDVHEAPDRPGREYVFIAGRST